MRTKNIELFKLSELSEEAKEKAIESIRELRIDGHWDAHICNEAMDSIKDGLYVFGFELMGWDIDFNNPSNANYRISQPSENVSELWGLRLRTYIINNYSNVLYQFKPFGEYPYKRRSKIKLIESDCPFTGVCYDYIFLEPIYEFLKKPEATKTLSELMGHCVDSVLNAVEKELEFRNSDEAITEEIEANEYEFLQDGTKY